MEALGVIALAIAAGYLIGSGRQALASRRSTEPSTTSVGLLRELVSEHLGLARDRLGAAEARIALLEERMAFHDGFVRVGSGPGEAPPESLGVRLERVARWRGRHAGAGPLRPDATPPGILPFPDPREPAEETPNIDE